MAPFPRKLLAEHEKIVFDLKPHWIALVVPSLWALGLAAVWFIGFKFVGDQVDGDTQKWTRIALAVVMLTALFYLSGFPFMKWATTHFVLTTDRLITRHGILAKSSREIPLERINDVAFHQSLFHRMVGAGDLMIESAGERGQSRFNNVRKPEDVQLMIYKESEANNNRMARGEGPTSAAHSPEPAPAEPREQTVTDQIEALARLKDSGAITELEYEQKKQDLLKRL